MKTLLHIYTRLEWRQWLEQNFRSEKEAWLVFPAKSTGKAGILYNDAVEEALYFGWIDSIRKRVDAGHTAQRFSPRKPTSSYSQPNRERLRWLAANNLLHPEIVERVRDVLSEPFVYPPDIVTALQQDEVTWRNFQNFSESYKRIRIAYIQDARNRPGEFEKRLRNFLAKSGQNRKIRGHGGVEKYY